MATVKVFDVIGVRELICFDTLEDVPYIDDEDFAESATDPTLSEADDLVED